MENKKTLEANLYYMKKKISSKIFRIKKRSTIFRDSKVCTRFYKSFKKQRCSNSANCREETNAESLRRNQN